MTSSRSSSESVQCAQRARSRIGQPWQEFSCRAKRRGSLITVMGQPSFVQRSKPVWAANAMTPRALDHATMVTDGPSPSDVSSARMPLRALTSHAWHRPHRMHGALRIADDAVSSGVEDQPQTPADRSDRPRSVRRRGDCVGTQNPPVRRSRDGPQGRQMGRADQGFR